MRATLTGIVLSIVGGGACAQPANQAIKGLESCFQVARLADAICSNATNDPVQRLDCFQKARAAQLECLQHVMSAGPAAPETPTTGTVSPATPTVRPEMPRAVSPGANMPTGIVSPKSPAGAVPAEMPNSTVSPDKSTGAVPPDVPAGTVDIPAKPPDTDWVVSETMSPSITALRFRRRSAQRPVRKTDRTLSLFAVVNYAPSLCFVPREHGAFRAPAK
jgi:hypothetical protein